MTNNKYIIEDNEFNIYTLAKNESVFSQTNGYIGVRGNFEEGYKANIKTIRGTYINSCYDLSKAVYGEKFSGYPDNKQSIINIHDVQTVYITINGHKFSLFSGEIIEYDRSLDMQKGITKRSIRWRSEKGDIVDLQFTRMVSFKVKELFLIDIKLTAVNFSGEVSFESMCDADVYNYFNKNDPRINSEKIHNLVCNKVDIIDDIISLNSTTSKSKIDIITMIKHEHDFDAKISHKKSNDSVSSMYHAKIQKNQTITFTKNTVFCCSLFHDTPYKSAFTLLSNLDKKEDLYAYQLDFLNKKWDIANIDIDSSDNVDISLRYCIYQLLSFSKLEENSSIPAKGLSGEGYEGHIFWDTELFVLPFYIYTDPNLAKRLLMFRYNQLDKARQNAKKLGHKCGAAYPWRTITGQETSTFFPGGSAQYHINADIAHSVIQYYLVTGDVDFIQNQGAEIIFETARIWIELGNFVDDEFHINTVTGPDEYTCLVNNNYYTNIMAKNNLKWAVKLFNKFDTSKYNIKLNIKKEEIKIFKKAGESMRLGYDSDLNITPQDDSFLQKKEWDFEVNKHSKPLLLNFHPMTLYRYKICKQADVVLAHFLFQDNHDKSVMKDSYDYYEKVTTHDSSLSACIYSIMAARLGNIDKSYNYFNQTIRMDLDNAHLNTADGLHIANVAGAYLSVTSGFAGILADENSLKIRPVLPDKWKSYKFRIVYKNSVYEIYISDDKKTITLIQGEKQNIFFQ